MNWEFEILNGIQNIRCSFLDWLMPKITMLGDAGCVWLLLCALLIIFPKTRRAGVVMALSLVLNALMCNCILKPLVGRTRPYDVDTSIILLINRQKDFSFPSGHTAISFAAAASLYLTNEKKLFIFSSILAILIAFSRMYLYVHYPTDILGGMIVGILSAIFANYIYKKVTF